MHNFVREMLLSARNVAGWAVVGAVLAVIHHLSSGGIQEATEATLIWATKAGFAPFLFALVIALALIETVVGRGRLHVLSAKWLAAMVLRVIGIILGCGLVSGLVTETWTLAVTSLGYGALALFIIGAVVRFPPVQDLRDMFAALKAHYRIQ